MVEGTAPVDTRTPPPGQDDGGVDLSVIIPAYNEEERLPAFLESVLTYLHKDGRSFEVIVVDDGSADGTADAVTSIGADAPQLRLVSHERNAGKGAAVRTGMTRARGRLCLFADADGATRMGELPALEAAIDGGADIAIGSREGADKLVECSPLRRFLGRWFNRAVRMGSVKGIRDTQCGFKLFRRPSGTALFERVQEDGYAFDVEVLMIAQGEGLKVREVFVNWTEQPGSKVSLFRDGMRMLKAVRRIRKRVKRGEYRTATPRETPAREITESA